MAGGPWAMADRISDFNMSDLKNYLINRNEDSPLHEPLRKHLAQESQSKKIAQNLPPSIGEGVGKDMPNADHGTRKMGVGAGYLDAPDKEIPNSMGMLMKNIKSGQDN